MSMNIGCDGLLRGVLPTNMNTIALSDPISVDTERGTLFARACESLILDARDRPFVELSFWATLIVIPSAVMLFVPGVFNWWLGGLYVAGNLALFVDRYILMLHNTSHRPLFKPKYRWLKSYIPNVLGPFFGESPNTYFCHHLGMHHPENNLKEDLSSTMQYERDNAWHFIRYFLRFFFLVPVELPLYLYRKNRKKLAFQAALGELSWYALVGATALINWRATLVVFVAPFVIVRFLMMAGNWGQHAFIDAARPENCYVNSITCINTRYNRRCFNDGYHIGHHLKANRHWTELPTDFLVNRARYAEEGALVFEGIDFFGVWLMLMLKRYSTLSKHIVSLDGSEKDEARMGAVMRARTRPFKSTSVQ